MTDRIAFDLTRLFIGPITPTPRGIDRVDLGYARHFLEQWNGDCVGVLPTPWGIRWFNRDRSMNVINFIEDFWGETLAAAIRRLDLDADQRAELSAKGLERAKIFSPEAYRARLGKLYGRLLGTKALNQPIRVPRPSFN